MRLFIYSVTALLDYLDDAHVIGPSTTADLDGDGLPDDCDIADAVILLRALGGLGPGAGQLCTGP